MTGTRPRVLAWTIAALVLGVGATSLGSQQPRPNDPTQLRLLQNLASLELRVHGLEARIRLLEQRGRDVDDPGMVGTPGTHPSGPDRGIVSVNQCDDPTFVDARGVRRFKLECLTQGAPGPCDPPFAIDDLGIKRVNPTCSNMGR